MFEVDLDDRRLGADFDFRIAFGFSVAESGAFGLYLV
jgi:hypothetical protein